MLTPKNWDNIESSHSKNTYTNIKLNSDVTEYNRHSKLFVGSSEFTEENKGVITDKTILGKRCFESSALNVPDSHAIDKKVWNLVNLFLYQVT